MRAKLLLALVSCTIVLVLLLIATVNFTDARSTRILAEFGDVWTIKYTMYFMEALLITAIVMLFKSIQKA